MLHFDAQVVFYETFHTIFPQSVEVEPMISFSTKKTQIAKKTAICWSHTKEVIYEPQNALEKIE